MDLCLVYMPFGSIEPPPLGIALLSAAAKKAGLETSTMYPSFEFAQRMGYLKYNAVSMGLGGFQIAEWIFASAAFPEKRRNEEEYLKSYVRWERERNADKFELFFSDEEGFLRVCRGARQMAAGFIKEVGERILEKNPTIVGCSSQYHQNCASLALLRYLKRMRPELVTMMGGANCEGSMGRVIRKSFPFVDMVFSGEADEAIVPLCRSILQRGVSETVKDLDSGSVDGSAMDEAVMVDDLRDLPVPDYDDYLESRERFMYREALAPLNLSIETSRGCWWGQRRQCTFCGVNGSRMKFRRKSAEKVLSELGSLEAEYGCRTFMATDNILDMGFFGTLLKELAGSENREYDFFFEVTSNLSRQQIGKLAAAGVRRFQPGIESLHDQLLRLLNKGNSAISNVALLKYSLEQGVKVTWLVLVDIPCERDEWYSETASWLPMIYHLQPPHRIKPIRYDRYSEYHRHPEKYGISLEPLPWYSELYPLDDDEIEEFAYHFQRSDRSVEKDSGRGKKALVESITEWMRLHDRSLSEGPPVLMADVQQERTLIRDTRPCAVSGTLEIRGLSHRILQLCCDPVSMEDLDGMVEPESEAALEDAITALKDAKLVLEIGDRLLALPAREPIIPYKYQPDYSFPRIQAMMKERGLSYWDVLEIREKAIRSRSFSGLWL